VRPVRLHMATASDVVGKKIIEGGREIKARSKKSKPVQLYAPLVFWKDVLFLIFFHVFQTLYFFISNQTTG
jgi:hypothetical protein